MTATRIPSRCGCLLQCSPELEPSDSLVVLLWLVCLPETSMMHILGASPSSSDCFSCPTRCTHFPLLRKRMFSWPYSLPFPRRFACFPEIGAVIFRPFKILLLCALEFSGPFVTVPPERLYRYNASKEPIPLVLADNFPIPFREQGPPNLARLPCAASRSLPR